MSITSLFFCFILYYIVCYFRKKKQYNFLCNALTHYIALPMRSLLRCRVELSELRNALLFVNYDALHKHKTEQGKDEEFCVDFTVKVGFGELFFFSLLQVRLVGN